MLNGLIVGIWNSAIDLQLGLRRQIRCQVRYKRPCQFRAEVATDTLTVFLVAGNGNIQLCQK